MIKSASRLAAAASLALCCAAPACAENRGIVVSQEYAPLKILSYQTKFNTKADKPRVQHAVKYQNSSKQEIVSARFGVLEYNVYDELIDSFRGYTLEESSVGEKDSADFINEAPHANFYKKYGSAYIWVDSVRFSNGNVWKADGVQLLQEVKKMRPEITPADLVEKKSLPAD